MKTAPLVLCALVASACATNPATGQHEFSLMSGSRTTLSGLDAFVGTYEGTMQNLGSVTARAAHILHDREVYLVAGIAPARGFAAVEPELAMAVRSFRPLTRAEAEDIHPNRIDLYTARAGDSWQSVAERQGRGVAKATILAIMNGHDVDGPPRNNERLKVVVPG